MKNRIILFSALILLATFLIPSAGCAPKYGCPVYETTQAPTNRKGELSTKGGKSNLFPKHMRKNR